MAAASLPPRCQSHRAPSHQEYGRPRGAAVRPRGAGGPVPWLASQWHGTLVELPWYIRS